MIESMPSFVAVPLFLASIAVENDKLNLWKKCNDLLLDGTLVNNIIIPESPRLHAKMSDGKKN